MKKTRKVLALVMALAMLLSMSAFGASNEVRIDSIDNIRSIACQAPKRFSETADWNSVTIDDELPLYDLDGEIVAYCISISNANTQESGYIIVSASTKEFPVLQFCPSGSLPYASLTKNERAVYLGAGSYYSENSVNYRSIVSGQVIAKSELRQTADESRAQQTATRIQDFSTVRSLYISGNVTPTRSGNNLTGVPNWQWTLGCSPTSMGMIMGYHYGVSANPTISILATKFGTDIWGATLLNAIAPGTWDYTYDMGFSAPSLYGFVSVNLLGFPRTGATYNTKAIYQSEIDNDYPVFVSVQNAAGATPGFPDGFDDHSMVGVGYSFSELSGDYLILHTTATGDGDAFVTLSSNYLGDYAWFRFHP